MLECKKLHADQVTVKDVDKLKTHPVHDSDEWKVTFVNELLELRDYNDKSLGWEKHDIQETIDYVCTS